MKMERCKCGSYALNINPQSGLCDTCYLKAEIDRLKSQNEQLLAVVKKLLRCSMAPGCVFCEIGCKPGENTPQSEAEVLIKAVEG